MVALLGSGHDRSMVVSVLVLVTLEGVAGTRSTLLCEVGSTSTVAPVLRLTAFAARTLIVYDLPALSPVTVAAVTVAQSAS